MKMMRGVVGAVLRVLSSLTIVLAAISQATPVQPALAAAILEVTPLTWNVIGLDSNNVTVGPNHFPVGARVCNTGDATATNVKSAFNWTSSDPYIDFRPGTNTSYTANGINLAPAECHDFYYEVEVTRNAAAYNHTRRYTITASADGGLTGSTPTPRELFVEHLISQNRNAVITVRLDGVNVPVGGAMVLTVGNTYNIQLVGSTATNGYNQLESFISLANTIFAIQAVTSTYSVSSLGSPITKLYADACGWDNNPLSPTYRSCIGSDGKSGGSVTTTYRVTIIGGGGTSESINTLLYDFSGSSFHYNSDFSSSARVVEIIDPGTVTIAKAFAPSSTIAGGLSTLTFSLTNPSAAPVSDVNFSDNLPSVPGQMVVAASPSPTTSNCGSPVFSPIGGSTTISFTQGSIPANGTCVISLKVSVPATPTTGVYTNTTNSLFIGAADTGHTASASLTVTSLSAGAGLCNLTLAQWTMATTPVTPTTKAGNVVTATATAGQGLTAQQDNTDGNPLGSALTFGWNNAGPVVTSTYAFYQYAIDTSQYTGVHFQYDASRKSNGPDELFIYYSTNGISWTLFNITGTNTSVGSWTTYGPYDFTGLTANGTTYWRFYGLGANTNTQGSDINFDNVTFTGCGTPAPLTLNKAFTPSAIAINSTSVLTFSVVNTNSAMLTGVRFTDDLPAGLEVAAVPAASTSGCGAPTFAPSAGATSLTFTGGTVLTNSTCLITVTVTALTAGPHLNVTGVVSSTETGPNNGPGGSGTATLTALLPPTIAKNFITDPILSGGLSQLSFALVNPNPNNALSAVAFTDVLPTTPGAMRVATPPGASTSGCGAPTFAPVAGAGSFSFSGGTIAAGGVCLVTVTVTALTTGIYTNTTSPISATVSGVTITSPADTDTLVVTAPNPGLTLAKQVSDNAAGPWSNFIVVSPTTNVYYRLIVENTGDVPLSPVTVSDPDVDLSSCTWPNPLPAASPTQDPTATCVLGPFSAVSGDVINNATAQGVYTGTNTVLTTTAQAEYLGAAPGLNLVKQVGLDPLGPWETELFDVPPGADLYYRFVVFNNGETDVTGLHIVDDTLDTSGCALINPLPIGVATNCTVGPVTAATALGTYTNTATAEGIFGVTPITSNEASASYTPAGPDLVVAKTNDAEGQTGPGVPFTWTVTITNAGFAGAVFSDSVVLLSDPLPVDATYGAPVVGNVVNVTNSGNVDCAITAGTLTCTATGANVTIGAGGGFQVSFSAVPTISSGDLVNTATVDPGAVISETDEANNTVTDTVSVATAATLGGFVWFDPDHNGIQDLGELGAAGVLVTLQTPTGTITTTTDASGLYTFTNLISGTHFLTFTALSGFNFVTPNQGGDDNLDSDADPITGGTGPINLTTGELNTTYDAGLSDPTTVGGFVWYDADHDGQQDLGEFGLPGVLVTVDGPSGLLTTTTDASGLYTFTNLISGTYFLTFTTPLGFTPTVQNAGPDSSDSDPDPLTGIAGPIILVNNQVDLTWDAGYWQQPTVIELASFTATVNPDGSVTLAWVTAVEIDTAGFNLYRSNAPNGSREQLNPLLIGAQGQFGGGGSYTYADQPGAGSWYYWLEDVDTQNQGTLHGPVTVTVGSGGLSAYRLYLPLAGH